MCICDPLEMTYFVLLFEHILCHKTIQGCTNRGRPVAMGTKLCTLEPNIVGSRFSTCLMVPFRCYDCKPALRMLEHLCTSEPIIITEFTH